MSEEKDLGSINVEMGNNNNIQHIGHKIVFNEPAPPPNAMIQNGRVVGEIGSKPVDHGDSLTFALIFANAHFDWRMPFEVQGTKLSMESHESALSYSRGGRPPEITFENSICKILQ